MISVFGTRLSVNFFLLTFRELFFCSLFGKISPVVAQGGGGYRKVSVPAVIEITPNNEYGRFEIFYLDPSWLVRNADCIFELISNIFRGQLC